MKVFVQTKNYLDVRSKLEQYRHVTICGASGEGKTTMSLMLAGEYQKKGYKVVFVENIDSFNLNECLKVTPKQVIIFDDVFGSVGLSTNVTHLRNMFNSLLTYLQQCAFRRINCEKFENRNKPKCIEMKQEQSPDICIVFSSKSYNFQNGMDLLQHERFSLFDESSVVDLTTNKDYGYSESEKIAIFDKYRKKYSNAPEEDLSKEDICNISDTLFGFPMTCRLFMDNPSFRDKGKEFFQKPLLYLRLELRNLLSIKNDQSAALALMLLCDNKLGLPGLLVPGLDKAMDDKYMILSNSFPSTTRIGVYTAARGFIGTFFSGADVLQFAHNSIYDACACAMYHFNPGFVLRYCSYDFLYDRMKAEADVDEISEDTSNYIIVSDGYFNIVAIRMCEAMKQGIFTKSITHPISGKDPVIKKLIELLETEFSHSTTDAVNWIHKKDKGKGFLYWAVQGQNFLLADKVENVLKIKFTIDEIREALDAAVEKDNLTMLALLLSRMVKNRHAEITSKLLLLSAEHGSLEAARYLLEAEADVNTVDDYKRNSMHIACYFGHANVLTVLLPLTNALINSVSSDGCTPAMLAALTGHEECFQLVIDETNTERKDKHGNSVTHLACRGGKKTVVERLVLPSNINSKGQHGWSPVMQAVATGHLSVFDFLVFKGADLSIKSDGGDSLLHLASQGGNTDIVEKLMPSVDIDSKGMYGWTPAMKAVANGHLSVFDFLVSKNPDLKVESDGGDSLLHLACQGGNATIVEKLVPTFEINRKGMYGWTPVMKAAAYGHQSIFNFLMSKNADCTVVDEYGDGLLHLACKGGNIAIVQQLVFPSNINITGQHKWTPLMNAVVNGNQNLFYFLVSSHANLTPVDEYGDSLFHLACQGGNTAIVQQLLSPNINSRGEHAMTPAMKAAYNGHREVLELLIAKHADLTLLDEDGDDIGCIAMKGGHTHIVEFLKNTSS